MNIVRYLAGLTTGRIVLWCYLIWYLVVLVRYFDPNPRLWLTSLGLAGIIGIALYISTTAGNSRGAKLERWAVARLFIMPFCVSSYSALVKGQGFILIFSPRLGEVATATLLCIAFVAAVLGIKAGKKSP